MHSFFKFTFCPKFPVFPAASSPQCQEDKHGLEEQSDKTQIVGVETKGIDVVHILIDVTREDGYIEECQQSTCDCPFLRYKEDDAQAKGYFNDT